jgi:Uma2 family endonuclease
MNAPAVFPEPKRLKVGADLYDAMIRGGVFGMGPRVELRAGELIEMNAQHVPHAKAKMELAFEMRLRLRGLGSRFEVLAEVTVRLDDWNMPDPDVVVWDPVDTVGAIPVERVKLLAEIAHTTLDTDLRIKRDLYAQSGVPEYWVFDVYGSTMHMFDGPDGGRYRNHRIAAAGETCLSATIPDLQIDTARLR